MIVKNKNSFYEIEELKLPGLVHGFSTKQFGNMAYKYGEKDEVNKNRIKFAEAVGIDLEKTAQLGLVHGTKTAIITKKNAGKLINPKYLDGYDGVITNEPNLALWIMTGDCAPFLFFDPSKKIIGIAHSGWRGTVAKLPTIMFTKMVINFGCKPENILIGIGPSIEKCHYVKSRPIFPEDFPDWKNFLSPKQDNKIRIDLNGFSIEQLVDIGAKRENIFYSNFCTFDHNEDFNCSQRERTEEDKPGRFASVIQMV